MLSPAGTGFRNERVLSPSLGHGKTLDPQNPLRGRLSRSGGGSHRPVLIGGTVLLLLGTRENQSVRRAVRVHVSAAERAELEAWTARSGPFDRLRIRARIVLEAERGRTNGEIARHLGIHTETVARWRQRFVVNRVEGLRREAPRSGGRRPGAPELVDEILRVTLHTKPPNGSPWTTRTLARSLHVSHMLVHRVWKAHGISPSSPGAGVPTTSGRPWLDLVGVYIDSPAAALVFGVGLREAGVDASTTRPRIDANISGGFLISDPPTLAPLAEALVRAEGLLPRLANSRRSPNELLVFLRSLDESTPPGTQLHVIFDRPLEQIPDRVEAWLKTHPRFRVRSVPTDGSWAATATEWLHTFHDLSLHPDSLRSVESLTESMNRVNRNGRFSWTLRAPRRSSPARAYLGRSRGPTAVKSSRARSSPARAGERAHRADWRGLPSKGASGFTAV
jgi:transposase